jgi:hypothetical protein
VRWKTIERRRRQSLDESPMGSAEIALRTGTNDQPPGHKNTKKHADFEHFLWPANCRRAAILFAPLALVSSLILLLGFTSHDDQSDVVFC